MTDRKSDALTIVPLSLKQANAFVGLEHRHHAPTVGHKWSVGVVNESGKLVGVAISGRPVSRHLQAAGFIEVLRLATDGTPNACSALYGTSARAAIALGYPRHKVITYTLASEPGGSLRAAGWVAVAESPGGSWSAPGRPREDNPLAMGAKIRWHAAQPITDKPVYTPASLSLGASVTDQEGLFA